MGKTNVLENDDLSGLFCKQAENEGVWIQFVDKDEKEWDIELLVYGNDSDVVQKYTRDATRRKLKNMKLSKKGKIEFDDETIEETLSDETEPTLIKLGGVRKFSTKEALKMNGKELPSIKDSKSEQMYRELIEASPDIKEFIEEQAADRSNFLAARKKS